MPSDSVPPIISSYVSHYTKSLTRMLYGLEQHGFGIDCIHVNPLDAFVIAKATGVEVEGLRFRGYPVHLDGSIARGAAGPITTMPPELEDKSVEEIEELVPRIFGFNAEMN